MGSSGSRRLICFLFACLLLIIGAASFAAAGELPAGGLDARDLEGLEPLVSRIPDQAGELAGLACAFHFRDQRIQQTVFRKVRRQNVWHNLLYWDRVTYRPESGELCFDATLYQYTDRRKPLLIRLPFAVKVDETAGRAAVRAADRLTLEAVLSGRFQSAAVNPDKSYGLALESPRVKLLAGERPLLAERAARLLRPEELPAAGSGLSSGAPIKETAVLEMEAEAVEGLKFYADWEPDLDGWYAREITRGVSGKGLAVVSARNTGASFTLRLPQPLPAGLYRVQVQPHYNSARFRDNILEVRLGRETARLGWFYVSDWPSTPVIEAAGPVSEVVIKAVQVGGGGLNAAPEWPELVILLDKIRITRVEEKP
ncbi:MAG TPA: hypothetical protein PKN80_04035 [bacterium]|uniref:Uncharacterized protein n=1 Tax=candidate division TA06 bacterium ADurb.Bin417 TaxID=1852828 RepID=A0A1V5M734_UNCT6|nr:MAG: hypothetical protein BWY73_01593 [candidate division TA06 bacterium ADurb.Bin417]HNQ35214.1 hypothetical protein [bacterium]HNS49045.1 hypothetical protein [bacterium]